MHRADPTNATSVPSPSPPGTGRTLDYAGGSVVRTSPAWSDLVLAWADRYRRWVFLAMVLVCAAGFNPQWRPEPDSALYLSIGRNLVEGHGYTFHGKAHRLAYPGVPLLFGGLFKAFHTHSLLPALVLMPLLGLAALGLVYRLFLLHAGRPTAVVVTVGVGMTRLFYRYSFELLTDLPFLLGVLMFLVGYEAIFHSSGGDTGGADNGGARIGGTGTAADAPCASPPRAHWFDYASLAGGLVVAVTTRPAMWALVFAVVGAVGWSIARSIARSVVSPTGRRSVRWRPLLAQVVVSAAVVAAVAVFYLRDPRRSAAGPAGASAGTTYVEEDQMFEVRPGRLATMARRLQQNVGRVVGRNVPKASFGMEVGTPLGLVLGGLLVGLGVALAGRRPLWGLFVAATVGMILLVPKPADRYVLPILPLLVFAWWSFLRRLNLWLHRRRVRWGNWAFLALFAVGATANGEQVFDFVFEQRRPRFLEAYKDGRYASIYEAAAMVRDPRHTGPSGSAASPETTWVLVGPKYARVLSLLGDRYAIEPETGTSVRPGERGAWRHVYVLEPSDPDPDDDRRDAAGRRVPTVREWLDKRDMEIVPEPIASAPNKDPGATSPVWTLHAIRPKVRSAPATAPTTEPAP